MKKMDFGRDFRRGTRTPKNGFLRVAGKTAEPGLIMSESDDSHAGMTGINQGSRLGIQDATLGTRISQTVESVLVLIPALLVAFLLITSSTAMGVSWTQAGYDAARTGNAPGSSPNAPEVAFEIELPGTLALLGTSLELVYHQVSGPLVHDGVAYMLVNGFESEGEQRHAVVRVDLDAAEVEPFVVLESNNNGIALDKESLFVSTIKGLTAYNLSDGQERWSLNPVTDDPDWAWCAQPAVRDGVAYHACSLHYGSDEEPTPRAIQVVAAVDAESGQDHWIKSTTVTDAVENSFPLPRGMTVTESHVFITEIITNWITCYLDVGVYRNCYMQATLILKALNAQDGTDEWRIEELAGESENEILGEIVVHTGEETGLLDRYNGMGIYPTGTTDETYVRIQNEVLAFNPHQQVESTDDALWREPIGDKDRDPGEGMFGGFALDDDALYATSSESVYRFSLDKPQDQWRFSLDSAYNERFAAPDVVVTDETLYVMATWRDGDGSTLYALEKDTKNLLWRHEIPPADGFERARFEDGEEIDQGSVHVHSLGDGVITVAGRDGKFQVIGTTNASLKPSLRVTTSTPQAGEQSSVDLSDTEPGAFGEATLYKAEWGDGTVTDWQDDPILTHAYAEDGDVTARFWVANENNQTASVTKTFYVGEEAPAELNFLQEMFARENQDLTFGVFGILLAVSGGAVGVARQQRKKHRLKDALEGVERAFAETKSQPLECEAQLTERKAHARGLMLDGQLGEDQFKVVTDRIEELRAELRIATVREEFAFLPHNVARALEEMLQDGRVATMEHEGALAALENAEGLTPEYKEKVRTRVNEWYNRDRGEQGE